MGTISQRPATSYNHTQTDPANVWVIPHGLMGYPIVDAYIMNEGVLERIMPAAITYVDLNTCNVVFSTPRAGYATVV
jgi:hypothetical protein